MALCPFARQLLLPETDGDGIRDQPRITPRVAILHSAAGLGSLYRFFLNSSNLESQFWVGRDGDLEQYGDTEIRADANLAANPFAVSIETESSIAATEPWTDKQVATLIRLLDWLCTVHPEIKRQQVPTWDGSGIGWHIMFGAPGPWTPVAKSCPGPARIVQARDVIIPAVAALPAKEEGFMSALTEAEQKEALEILRLLKTDYLTKGKAVRQVILETQKGVEDLTSGKRPERK